MNCENCKEKDSNVDLTMPLPIGIFCAKLCMECSLIIHNKPKMVMDIIKERASKFNYGLPMSTEQFNVCLNNKGEQK